MLTLTTRTDTHGNPVSGPQAAVDRYDTADRPPPRLPQRAARRHDVARHRRARLRDGPGPGRLPVPHLDRPARRRRRTRHRRPPGKPRPQRAGGRPSRGDRHLARRRLARRRPPPRRPPDPLAGRPARPARRSPTRLLPRRRGQPARPGRPLAPQHRPGPPAPRLRARHVRLRARRERALRARRTARVGGRRTQPRRRLGDPRRRARLRDAGPRRRRHPLPATGAKPTGPRATCSPSTTGGTWRSTCSRRDAPTSRCRSTTGTSTTRTRPACPSRCSTPAPCCGAFTSTASTRAAASLRWPTRGRHARQANPGTCSTTCTR